MVEKTIDIAIVTALQIELDAVLRHLGEYETIQEDNNPYTYYRGQLLIPGGDERYEVVVGAFLDMGNVPAGVATTRLIERWRPGAVIMVGIAGGIPGKVFLGDIVVGKFSHYYEIGKLTEHGRVEYGKQAWPDQLLYRRAEAYNAIDWRSTLTTPRPSGGLFDEGQLQVCFGPIAAGESVVANAADRDELVKGCPKLLAVAMEGAGVAEAAISADERPRFVEVRGVCDYCDKDKDDRWQAFAAEAAAAFTIGFLRSRPLVPATALDAEAQPQGRPLLVLRAQSLQALDDADARSALPQGETARVDIVTLDFLDLVRNDQLTDPAAAIERLVGADSPLLEALARRADERFAFYGLLHIPLAFLAGHLVSDRQHVDLLDYHRGIGSWHWPESDEGSPDLVVDGLPAEAEAQVRDAIVRVPISYSVTSAQARQAVPAAGIDVQVGVAHPTLDVVRSEDQIRVYGDVFRQALDNLAALGTQRIHVFYAGPVALAFHLGQRISMNIHPPVVVWYYKQGRYTYGVDLAAAVAEDSSIVMPPPDVGETGKDSP